MDRVTFTLIKNLLIVHFKAKLFKFISLFKMIYENYRYISQRIMKILKSIMAILFILLELIGLLSLRKFQDGGINRLIIEIEIAAINNFFFE